MKLSAIIIRIFFLIGATTASGPHLSISIRDGSFRGGLDDFDPTFHWTGASRIKDVDLSYGIISAARLTANFTSIPRNIWAKASTSISGWGLTAKAYIDCQNYNNADFEIIAGNKNNKLRMKMLADAAVKNFHVRSMEVTKRLDLLGARLSLTPKIDLDRNDRSAIIKYSNGDSDIKISASANVQEVEISHHTAFSDVKLVASVNGQEMTVSKQIDDKNRVAPTINSNGDVSVEWERSLEDGSSLTTTFRPNDSVDIEWKDDAWTGNVNMALDGNRITGTNISV
eukprot:CAMPEP_0178924904 /NCGR_PEP_ID=MMETSP0786-20121207/17591_1 /TAXON_ID=186022 /ORGANISM="Thalassionema frauenfeldii, Strain CCMP 1798" /LENGTH=283 /DNA_ID=CAMNT_0020599677 /DNA_START=157 /DNA_END=1005 /DNA_ORIENTATION=-